MGTLTTATQGVRRAGERSGMRLFFAARFFSDPGGEEVDLVGLELVVEAGHVALAVFGHGAGAVGDVRAGVGELGARPGCAAPTGELGAGAVVVVGLAAEERSEEHTSEL